MEGVGLSASMRARTAGVRVPCAATPPDLYRQPSAGLDTPPIPRLATCRPRSASAVSKHIVPSGVVLCPDPIHHPPRAPRSS
jgi:hypothetical protein